MIRLIIISLLAFNAVAQVAPFVDFSGYFRSFHTENFRHIEFQPILSYQAGDNMVAYLDTRNDFKLYDGEKVQLITNQIVKYKISDGQLAWNIANMLVAWVEGEKKTLTIFADWYDVSDSLVVFEDNRYNSVSVLYKGEVKQLYQMTGDLVLPVMISDNIVVFRDNGDFYKFFWRGEIYDLGVWSQGIDFKGSKNMVCFNDPTHRSFAVFENGEFLDVEEQYVHKYKAGWGFCLYEDLNRNLYYYSKGEKHQLSNFSSSYWDVQDNAIVWSENSFYYTYYNGQKIQLTNYSPKEIQLKNNIIAFRNQMGGVSAFMNGKLYEITNQPDSKFKIYGETVLVELFNKTFIAFRNGKKYEA
jgi:hypothetical protein